MLISLRIENVVLIEALDITLEPGLAALTGETGAGKSILLDSLGLAIGARAEARLVRSGAEQAQVTAVFDVTPDHPGFTILHAAGIDAPQGEPLILRRSLAPDGRSRAYINDQPVSIGLLRQVGDTLVEVHGQFETQSLLDPATHIALLDSYAGLGGETESAWYEWHDRQKTLNAMRETIARAAEKEEFLRTSLADLDALDPQEGEEDMLAAKRERLMNRERVLEGLNAAYEALNAESDPVQQAQAALSRVAQRIEPEGGEIMATLDRAATETREAAALIEKLSAELSEDGHDLETIDERLHALRIQARKHHCMVDDLPRKREDLATALNALERGEDALADQIKITESARAAYIKASETLSTARRKSAAALDKRVNAELAPLRLDKARFLTEIEDLEERDWGPAGMNRVRFLVSTNPGAPPGPLNKIASGGEMARFMLALKVVMARTGSAETLIFDEVDAGIGGAVADAVGERLARLAASKQVLVVTHAPQVAARAGTHFIVRKHGTKTVTTAVEPLATREQRCEEIARMLAGAEITNEARAAAGRLLESGMAA